MLLTKGHCHPPGWMRPARTAHTHNTHFCQQQHTPLLQPVPRSHASPPTMQPVCVVPLMAAIAVGSALNTQWGLVRAHLQTSLQGCAWMLRKCHQNAISPKGLAGHRTLVAPRCMRVYRISAGQPVQLYTPAPPHPPPATANAAEASHLCCSREVIGEEATCTATAAHDAHALVCASQQAVAKQSQHARCWCCLGRSSKCRRNSWLKLATDTVC